MRGLDAWIEGDSDRLVRVQGECPICGDITVVNVLPDEAWIIYKMGRLCSECYRLQEIVR